MCSRISGLRWMSRVKIEAAQAPPTPGPPAKSTQGALLDDSPITETTWEIKNQPRLSRVSWLQEWRWFQHFGGEPPNKHSWCSLLHQKLWHRLEQVCCQRWCQLPKKKQAHLHPLEYFWKLNTENRMWCYYSYLMNYQTFTSRIRSTLWMDTWDPWDPLPSWHQKYQLQSNAVGIL